MGEIKKQYTVVHLHKHGNFSIKSTFSDPVTLAEARALGRQEADESDYKIFAGVMNVDIFNSQIPKRLKELVGES